MTKRIPTESDLSGSNYSKTKRGARKRKGVMETGDESSSNAEEDKESPLKDKSRGKGKATSVGVRDMASSNKGKR